MATITTLASGDSGSVSLGVINTNFDNLNTDKIEATQTVALTNKTIDGDLNTVQDLPYTAIKSTARTGLDVKIVTGTAGDTDELVKWNADGDVVSTDITTTTTAPTSSSTDLTIPTSQAVYEAILEKLTVKQLYVPCIKSADTAPYTPSALAAFAFAQLDSAEVGYFSFHCPADFVSLTSVELVMIPDATENVSITTITTNIGADGENYNNHIGTVSSPTLAVTADKVTKWRIDNLTGTPFASMMANDMVGVSITSGTTMLRVIGLLVKYSS